MEITKLMKARAEVAKLEKELREIEQRMEQLKIDRSESGAWLKYRYNLLRMDLVLMIGKKKDEAALEEIKMRMHQLLMKKGEKDEGSYTEPDAAGMPDHLRRAEAGDQPEPERAGTGGGSGDVLGAAGQLRADGAGNAAGNRGSAERELRMRYRNREGARR